MTVEGKINSAGANLLKALITQIDKLQKPWQQLSASEQERVIFHLREAVTSGVRSLVEELAAAELPRVPATVESVAFKDGVKVVLKLAKGEGGAHDLADATGGQALVVLASHQQFVEGIDRIKAKADQAELFEQHDIDVDTPQTTRSSDPSSEKAPPDSGVPQTVFGLLASVGCNVPLEIVQCWTKEELIVAADWAHKFANTPEGEMCEVARPHWLPIPEPKTSDDGTPLGPIELTAEEREMAIEDEGSETITLEGGDEELEDDDNGEDTDVDADDDEELEDEQHEDDGLLL